MGRAKEEMMRRWELEAEEDRTNWIREQLDDWDADETTEGWDVLAAEYDNMMETIIEDNDWYVPGKTRMEIFEENIDAANGLLLLSPKNIYFHSLLVMLHGHVVAAVEAYLSSTFIEMALCSELYMRRLVETDPALAERTFSMKELFTKREALKSDLSKYLKDLIFHNIAKIKPMYLTVFNIDFGDVGWLFQAIALRHHCVHRAGYDKEGKQVQVTEASIGDLIEQCRKLITGVEDAIKKLPIPQENFFKTMDLIPTPETPADF